MSTEDENQVPKIPDLSLAQLYFLLQQSDELVPNKDTVKKELIDGITSKSNFLSAFLLQLLVLHVFNQEIISSLANTPKMY